MKIRKYARAILGILHRKEDGTWTTIHPRWDMELFSYLFSSQDEDEIDDRKVQLTIACTSIFGSANTQFSISVISVLYDMAGERRIPINIVNDVVKSQITYQMMESLCIQYTHITKAVLITS